MLDEYQKANELARRLREIDRTLIDLGGKELSIRQWESIFRMPDAPVKSIQPDCPTAGGPLQRDGKIGASDGIRTHGPQIHNLVL